MIIKAIHKINPNAKVIVNGEDINTCEIQWLDGTTPIPVADIEAQFPTVELEIALKNLRSKRNQLLQDTDFHGMSDNTMSADMTTYRQELRDITEGVATKEQAQSVVFPSKP